MALLAPSLRRHLLYTTAAVFGSACVFFNAEAFNPNADSETTLAPATLPDGKLLVAPRGTKITTKGGYIPPVTQIEMPSRPLYPARADAMPITYAPPAQPTAVAVVPNPTAATTLPAIVVPSTAVTTTATTTVETTKTAAAPAPAAPAKDVLGNTGFIAPAPVLATTSTVHAIEVPTPAAPAIVAAPAPASLPPAVIPVERVKLAAPEPLAPANSLQAATAAPTTVIVPKGSSMPIALPTAVVSASPMPNETKSILSHVPSQMDTVKVKAGKVNMDRVSPEVASVLGKDTKVEAYEAVGLSIKVRRPGLDANYELNRAYTALMGGETEQAVKIYKDILLADNQNQDALFGLAATYHRIGQLENARPLYGKLLQINPNHREGLNNFLALISEESPNEALAELTRLEERNPEFSPIAAQSAILLDKLGYAVEARNKMVHAIELAPENLTYKYNLAVMLDRQGIYADASALYRLLIDASLKGAIIPANTESLQKRLNYITTAQTENALPPS